MPEHYGSSASLIPCSGQGFPLQPDTNIRPLNLFFLQTRFSEIADSRRQVLHPVFHYTVFRKSVRKMQIKEAQAFM
jgi:hypothetical protein